ncbi:hypothetical protein ACFL57_04610 [Candidatus Margulisiibacteriota bacterium]
MQCKTIIPGRAGIRKHKVHSVSRHINGINEIILNSIDSSSDITEIEFLKIFLKQFDLLASRRLFKNNTYYLGCRLNLLPDNFMNGEQKVYGFDTRSSSTCLSAYNSLIQYIKDNGQEENSFIKKWGLKYFSTKRSFGDDYNNLHMIKTDVFSDTFRKDIWPAYQLKEGDTIILKDVEQRFYSSLRKAERANNTNHSCKSIQDWFKWFRRSVPKGVRVVVFEAGTVDVLNIREFIKMKKPASEYLTKWGWHRFEDVTPKIIGSQYLPFKHMNDKLYSLSTDMYFKPFVFCMGGRIRILEKK